MFGRKQLLERKFEKLQLSKKESVSSQREFSFQILRGFENLASSRTRLFFFFFLFFCERSKFTSIFFAIITNSNGRKEEKEEEKRKTIIVHAFLPSWNIACNQSKGKLKKKRWRKQVRRKFESSKSATTRTKPRKIGYRFSRIFDSVP